jgi:putative DNA-invertase from lambdoid prophage Rac
MKVAIYCRVSTDEQTTENQLPSLMAYCQSRGWDEPVVYAENESAWKQGHQRELARLLDEMRTGRRHFDYLVIFALDRLTRGKIGDVVQLLNSFEIQGCKIVSLKESWLSDAGPMRELFTLFIAWAGNYESERKSQNTKAGLVRAKVNGVKLGRPMGKKDSKKRRKKRPVVYRHAPASVNTGPE